ncbi:hypothetical protein [Lysinibacillus sphaericus]|nr:hypothetical protein [Lysinibacillus sp. SDF0037]
MAAKRQRQCFLRESEASAAIMPGQIDFSNSQCAPFLGVAGYFL